MLTGGPPDHRDGMSRRRALKVGVLVAGGVWTAPVVQPIALTAASAQATSGASVRDRNPSSDAAGTETEVPAATGRDSAVRQEFAEAPVSSASTRSGEGVQERGATQAGAGREGSSRTGASTGGPAESAGSRRGIAPSRPARRASPTVGSNVALTG